MYTIKLLPTQVGSLTVNRIAILQTTFFNANSLNANYNFTIVLADASWNVIDSSYVSGVQQTASITGTDYEPAFNSFAYAQPLIEAQAANW